MKQDELKNIILDLFDDFTDEFDLYTNPNTKSLWGIFTDEKRWIFELTNEGTLWYNYNFFTSIFKYISLDVVENQHYITKWVEDTIKNGVKKTKHTHTHPKYIEDTIQNGVKKTLLNVNKKVSKVEDTIQNGVKDTIGTGIRPSAVEDTITNSIKHTEDGDWLDYDERIDDIIKNGIKQVKELPDKSGELRGYSDYYCKQEDITKPHVEYVSDVIKYGIKITKPIDYSDNTEHIVEGVLSRYTKQEIHK